MTNPASRLFPVKLRNLWELTPHARRVGNFVFLSGVGPRQRGTKQIPGVTLDSAGNIVHLRH